MTDTTRKMTKDTRKIANLELRLSALANTVTSIAHLYNPAVAVAAAPDPITSSAIVDLRYRIACLEKNAPRIAALEQMFDTATATTNSYMARLDGQLALTMDRVEFVAEHPIAPPDYVSILNEFFNSENGVSSALAEIYNRLFNLELINDRREISDVSRPSTMMYGLQTYMGPLSSTLGISMPA